MDFKAEDKITEIFEKLDLRAPQRSLPSQPSVGGSGNPNYNIGPVYIYAPGGPGGTGGGGDGGLPVDGGKATESTKMSVNKPVIIEVDMPYDMQQAAMDCATLAFIKHDSIWDVAKYIKEEFDKKHNKYWHCFVGPNFAFKLNHDQMRYIRFKMGEDTILLFKQG